MEAAMCIDYEAIARRLSEQALRSCERRFLDPDADYQEEDSHDQDPDD